MDRKIFMRQTITAGIFFIAAVLGGTEVYSAPRDSNFQRTGAYAPTRVEAKLLIPVRENADTLHFVRDNNDPRVITKTYILKHADAYEIRDCLRQMVQSKRVGNTALLQQFPGNTAPSPAPGNTATLSSVQAGTGSAQPTFSPPAQLGSNTAVECLKYADGTGILIISAEEYRFSDRSGGMGFDSIVKFLDRPQMGDVTGTQTFFYFPKNVPARNLQNLIQNVGMNIPDVTELWQGSDAVAYDPDLNLLIFDTANYSMDIVEKMLQQYDTPIPQVRLRLTVYEFAAENDEKLGVDFQSWKNNQGMDFFSGGGRFRNNWSALYSGGNMGNTGSERTGFYNFNPKWNTRYLDFLTARGKGKITQTAELLIRNNTPASVKSTRSLFYFEAKVPENEEQFIKFFSAIANHITGKDDIPVWKAPPQQSVVKSDFGFSMEIANASVTQEAVNFTVTLNNKSLIGFNSDGSPRFSESTINGLNITLPQGMNSFVIGGLRKKSKVTSSSGIPWLKDIPLLGVLFSTQSDSIKESILVVAGECSMESPENTLTPHYRSKGEKH